MTALTRHDDATRAGLLAAVLADPDDDTPRLIYADWLEEHDCVEERPCPACSQYVGDPDNRWGIGHRPERDPASGRHEGGWSNCKRCNCGGREMVRPGVVRGSNGYAERAELIRVQIEAERHPKHHTAETGCPLRKREAELLDRLGYYVVNTPQVWPVSMTLGGFETVTIRRGFVESWRMRAEDWLAHAGVLLASHPLKAVTLTTLPEVVALQGPSSVVYWFAGKATAPQPGQDDEGKRRAATLDLLRANFGERIKFSLPGD